MYSLIEGSSNALVCPSSDMCFLIWEMLVRVHDSMCFLQYFRSFSFSFILYFMFPYIGSLLLVFQIAFL